MGKLTISMAMFNSYVSHNQRVYGHQDSQMSTIRDSESCWDCWDRFTDLAQRHKAWTSKAFCLRLTSSYITIFSCWKKQHKQIYNILYPWEFAVFDIFFHWKLLIFIVYCIYIHNNIYIFIIETIASFSTKLWIDPIGLFTHYHFLCPLCFQPGRGLLEVILS